MDPRDRVLNILAWLCYSPLSASTVVAASITRDQQGNVRFDSTRGGNSTEEGESSLATIEIHFPSLFFSFFFFSISPENLIFSMRISTNVSLCYVNTNSITFLLVLAKLLTNSHRGFVIWECDLNDNRGEAHELSSRALEGQEENFGV